MARARTLLELELGLDSARARDRANLSINVTRGGCLRARVSRDLSCVA